MSIRTLFRRRPARAASAFACLAITAPIALAATDNDPTNDTMPGADALSTTVDELVIYNAELVQTPDQLDVDFFMIEALERDTVTVTLTRINTGGNFNLTNLSLRLHAYTQAADLISAPGVGKNPTLTFSPATDGVVYLGVGLACDQDLDGVDDTDPADDDGSIFEVETTAGFYDIEITIERQGPEQNAILFEDPADCEEEVNAFCPPTQTFFPDNDSCIIGSLEKRDFPDCEPDTFMVLFDKELNIIAADDNESHSGNGWASGLVDVNDANGFIDNGNGTRSLRIGVTGRPDGLDGDFNGYFLNAPHQQIGEFTLVVTYSDSEFEFVSEEIYTNRFHSGAEAFYINFDVPAEAASAHIDIDNTTGAIAALPDQDVFHLEGLIPYCDYYITQIGGLDWDCLPTDTVMVWVDKNCGVIWASNEYNEATGYEELLIIADYRGRANFAIAGEDQRGRLLWTGLDMHVEDTVERAPGDCELPDPDIDHGCYTLCFRLAPPHEDASGPMGSDNVAGAAGEAEIAILEAMSRGDINMDGRTNASDLGILLGAYGWTN